MTILVGIDEAGYGPALGPLVVASTVFEAPDELAEADLWKVLHEGVATDAGTRDRRMVIADSKRLHQGPDRLERLEKNVLATCPLPLPAAPEDLAAWLGAGCDHTGGDEPWYADPFPTLPLASDTAEIARLRDTFCAALDAAGISLRAVSARLVHPAQLNRLIGRTDNKAAVNWMLGAELMEEAVASCPGVAIRLTMDRQGGRIYYAELLQQTFPLTAIDVLQETSGDSRYRLAIGDRPVNITLLEKADGSSLPVALASMYAKYVREVFMHQFNRWWQARAADVAPTAGYWPDYRRWSAEMAPHLAALGLAPEAYIRSR